MHLKMILGTALIAAAGLQVEAQLAPDRLLCDSLVHVSGVYLEKTRHHYDKTSGLNTLDSSYGRLGTWTGMHYAKSYNASKQVSKMITYKGGVLILTDEYEYDSQGRETRDKRTDPKIDYWFIDTKYDALGRIQVIQLVSHYDMKAWAEHKFTYTGTAGKEEVWNYVDFGPQPKLLGSKTYKFDSKWRVIERHDFDDAGKQTWWYKFEYEAAGKGRILKETRYHGTDANASQYLYSVYADLNPAPQTAVAFGADNQLQNTLALMNYNQAGFTVLDLQGRTGKFSGRPAGTLLMKSSGNMSLVFRGAR